MLPDAPDRPDAYFLCATPRTGSSLLLGLLDSTGVAGRPQAYFRAPDEPLWADRWGIPRDEQGDFSYREYVSAALAAGRTGNGVFGAKLMRGTLDELLGKLGAAHPDFAGDSPSLLNRAFGRTGFLYLRREDVLAQAVSWLRAEQTNTWFIGGNGEIGGPGSGERTPAYDPERIGQLLRLIDEQNASWEAWFASHGVQPHLVCYEEIDADATGVTRRLLGSLGLELPPGRAIVLRHRRQADELNDQWAARYRAERRQAD
ncbi:Stf0 family sulfotransferase [Streptomyces sp. ACA25]|uniref:Stf0 family sulfotransferase n=1 Tax=Streptomyces sp. ACA25 TaxID=3022596 RepID=UPI002306E418|nr:Stf0 family sulfotransferase [Streptomyces sp. ACA25]MDB1089056.1 Stf0 family sulfotransferase [Streptomyces sp. ACA25]